MTTATISTSTEPKTKQPKPVYRHPDFIGTELVEGDLVAYSQGAIAQLCLGKVDGFTAKTIRIQPIAMPFSKNNGARGYSPLGSSRLTRSPAQVVKVSDAVQVLKDYPKDWIVEILGN